MDVQLTNYVPEFNTFPQILMFAAQIGVFLFFINTLKPYFFPKGETLKRRKVIQITSFFIVLCASMLYYAMSQDPKHGFWGFSDLLMNVHDYYGYAFITGVSLSIFLWALEKSDSFITKMVLLSLISLITVPVLDPRTWLNNDVLIGTIGKLLAYSLWMAIKLDAEKRAEKKLEIYEQAKKNVYKQELKEKSQVLAKKRSQSVQKKKQPSKQQKQNAVTKVVSDKVRSIRKSEEVKRG